MDEMDTMDLMESHFLRASLRIIPGAGFRAWFLAAGVPLGTNDGMLKRLQDWRKNPPAERIPTADRPPDAVAAPLPPEPRPSGEHALPNGDFLAPPLRPGDLWEASRTKADFLDALEAMILLKSPSEVLYSAIEAYFRRHGDARLVDDWGWEMILAASSDGDESLRAVMQRALVEAGLQLVALVTEQGTLLQDGSATLASRLAQAEWSIRRGNQTLCLDPKGVLNVTIDSPRRALGGIG